MMTCFSPLFAGEVKVDFQRKDGGPEGYYRVVQTWTGDEKANVKCTNPGYEACEFTSGASGVDMPLNMDELCYEILTGSFSGTIDNPNSTEPITYEVIENYGGGQGLVRFTVPTE